MKTECNANVIDFAAAVQSLRLRRRRAELQRLRAAQGARMAARAAPVAWAWCAPAAAFAPAAPVRDGVAR